MKSILLTLVLFISIKTFAQNNNLDTIKLQMRYAAKQGLLDI